jgi:hypothetical protein
MQSYVLSSIASTIISTSSATLALAFRPAPPPKNPAPADDKVKAKVKDLGDEEMQGMYPHVQPIIPSIAPDIT